jgi:hypothetical protein
MNTLVDRETGFPETSAGSTSSCFARLFQCGAQPETRPLCPHVLKSPDHSRNLRLLQIGDHGQNPAVVGFVASQVEFEEDRFDMLFDRSFADEEALGDGAV